MSTQGKPFIGIARVSSDEQQKRGFSLAVQEQRIREFASRKELNLAEVHCLSETAFVSEKRPQFHAILRDVRKNAKKIGGLIWCSVDRAVRNKPDELLICNLIEHHGIRIEFVDGSPDPSTPLGEHFLSTQGANARLFSRLLSANTQLSVRQRVREGLFVGRAPYGYKNVRVEGKSVSRIDPEKAPKVQRIFELYAFGEQTLDSLVLRLREEGITYTERCPFFRRKKIHDVLRDRAYIGEVRYKGQWYPGSHPPLIERSTFDRAQARLGGRRYARHTLVYSHGLVDCGSCVLKLTGESKTKVLSSQEEREYVYYRCARYNAPGHPRVRVSEAELDQQVLALFDTLRVDDAEVRAWIVEALQARTRKTQERSARHLDRLNTRLTRVRGMRDELLNGRLAREFDEETFARKDTELRDEEARLKAQIDSIDVHRTDETNLIVGTFELSQHLREQWLGTDPAAKRRILRILGLNWTLEGRTLVPKLRKPFDVLARGLVGAGAGSGDP